MFAADQVFPGGRYALNFRAPFLLTQGVAEVMAREKTGGSIVNIGSVNGHGGQSNLPVYLASPVSVCCLLLCVSLSVSLCVSLGVSGRLPVSLGVSLCLPVHLCVSLRLSVSVCYACTGGSRYSSTKGALTTMTKHAAWALRKERIRSNCIAVGWISLSVCVCVCVALSDRLCRSL